jgi:hypothetical protein
MANKTNIEHARYTILEKKIHIKRRIHYLSALCFKVEKRKGA